MLRQRWMGIGLILLGGTTAMARPLPPEPPSSPSNSVMVGQSSTDVPARMPQAASVQGTERIPPPATPGTVHPHPTPIVSAESHAPSQGLWDVISGSICGSCGPKREWTPLCFDTFFSEGWDESWIGPPNGSSGAPRQGWINSFDGHFTREFHLAYAFTDRAHTDNNAHVGIFQLQTPLNRRLWLGIDVPFIVALEGGNGVSGRSDFGDIVLTPRVMLEETQDLSVSAGLGIRLPTGDRATAGDLTSLFPFISAWADMGHAVTLRGGVGVDIPTENVSPDASLVANVSIGQTVTDHDATPFGDFAYYLAVNSTTGLGGGNEHTLVTLTPAIRTHLGHDLFFLAGIEVPITGPHGFDERAIFVFVKGF